MLRFLAAFFFEIFVYFSCFDQGVITSMTIVKLGTQANPLHFRDSEKRKQFIGLDAVDASISQMQDRKGCNDQGQCFNFVSQADSYFSCSMKPPRKNKKDPSGCYLR
ncbi:hypothetical protein EV426DRAFT_612700 [Tirmania nivea]|nr:hypothetical protein EV426DRAFT_612700 [Tirmania nivea]